MNENGKQEGVNFVPRRKFLASSGLVTTGLLAGCSGSDDGSNATTESRPDDGLDSSDDSETDTPAKEAESEVVQVAASHYPIVPSALVFPVSKRQGFYEEEGITLGEVTSFGGGGTTIRGVVTGGIPVAGGSAAAAVNAFSSGAPVHLIANIDEPPPIDVVAPADSDIGSIQDLAGKTVGYTNPGSISEQLLAASIKRADGISLDQVTLKAMGGLGETISGLGEGIIDAGWSNITVSIPRVENGEWKRVYGTWEYVTIPNLSLLAGQRTIEENAETLQGFVNAHIKAGEFYRNNTGEVAKIWTDLHDNIDEDLALKVLEKKIEISDVGTWTVGFQKSSLDQMEQAMQLSGVLDSDTSAPWKEVIDQRFLSDDKTIRL